MTAVIFSSSTIRFITGYWLAPWMSDTSRNLAAGGLVMSSGTNFSCNACESASRFFTYGVTCAARASTSASNPALLLTVPSRPVVVKLESWPGW
jgi:hypothetical protein